MRGTVYKASDSRRAQVEAIEQGAAIIVQIGGNWLFVDDRGTASAVAQQRVAMINEGIASGSVTVKELA